MTQEASTLPPGSVSVFTPTKLPADPLHNWLRLLLADGIGASTLNHLLDEYGNAERVVAAINEPGNTVPLNVQKALMQSHVRVLEQCLEWQAAKARRYIISYNDPCYPPQLGATTGAPALLFVEGNIEALHQPQIAIVGSRKATPSGLESARHFASSLAQQGLTICSGLALGVDASAHLGAINAKGRTVAVLGNGPDKIYPARHQSLAEDIIEKQGAIITEFPAGTPPLAKNFPQRNRVISGLSLGVLVIEATIRSGSLITARLAGEQGREVFAMPGSIHNPQARGCHKLLRDGAVLVESVEDILQELPCIASASCQNRLAQNLTNHAGKPVTDPVQARLLQHMGFDPVDTDTLVSRCGLTTERVSSMLLLLELQGSVVAIGGGRFQRCDTQR